MRRRSSPGSIGVNPAQLVNAPGAGPRLVRRAEYWYGSVLIFLATSLRRRWSHRYAAHPAVANRNRDAESD